VCVCVCVCVCVIRETVYKRIQIQKISTKIYMHRVKIKYYLLQ